MTIIVPEWVIYVGIIMLSISTFLSILHIRIQQKLRRINEVLAEERTVLNRNIGKLMDAEVRTQREKKAGWHKWTRLEYMEIKSPVIKRDTDCRGNDTIMFANGVMIARKPGSGADAKMDS